MDNNSEEEVIMYTEGFEKWFNLNNNLTNPLREWNKVTTEFTKRLAAQNIEMMNDQVTRFSHQLKILGNIKSPQEFIHLQNKWFNENLTANMEATQKIIRSTIENIEDITTLLGATTKDITNKVSSKIKKQVRKTKKRKARK
jgi:hypothetical protein